MLSHQEADKEDGDKLIEVDKDGHDLYEISTDYTLGDFSTIDNYGIYSGQLQQ